MRGPAVAARALLAAAVTGCGTGTGPDAGALAELERNRLLWERARPASYVFALERLCFCGAEARGPVRVEVEGADVVGRAYVDTGEEVPTGLADLFPAVDGLFATLRDAMVAGADEVRVTYDTVLGVPIDFWIDYEYQAADEELGMHVTEGIEPAP